MPAEARKGSLVDDVRLIFDLASLKREASRNLGADDWNELQQINEKHESQRRFVERDFELSYGDRFAAARKQLIDEAGDKARHLVPRHIGRDRFDKEAIDRQARLQVRHAYRNALDRIDREEAHQIEALLERANQRNQPKETPLRAFARAIDRRGGPDRRRNRD